MTAKKEIRQAQGARPMTIAEIDYVAGGSDMVTIGGLFDDIPPADTVGVTFCGGQRVTNSGSGY